MRKLAITGATVLILSAFTSCEKNYTCVCTYPGASIGTTETSFKTKKKSDAEASCATLNINAKATGGACALK